MQGIKKLYMLVTNDEYELPLIICDSAQELARITGTTRNAIYSAISHAENDGRGSRYKRVTYSEIEWADS